jgi:hypothetical protein
MPPHDDEFSQYRKAGVLAGNAAVEAAKLEGKPEHELNLIYETAYKIAYTQAFMKALEANRASARGGMCKRKISKTRKMRRKRNP